MKRLNISSGTKWEKAFGYSRAVKIGGYIFVSGTTAVDENGNIVGLGDIYRQTKFIYKKIGSALKEAGAGFEHVVRTRTFITNIELWEEAMKAHGEIFGLIKPAATLVQVTSLVEPDLLVEIEVDAFIENLKE